MNKIYRLIFLLPLFMLGCTPNVIVENKVKQKINSLDMTIFSKSGDKIYSINSPNSSYDNIELKFELKKPTINIFNGEETKYIISSEESLLLKNNKLLKLKGNVKLKTLKKNGDILYADNFIWNIENTHYLLEGNIRFENQNIILNSSKAILGSDNIIEFFNFCAEIPSILVVPINSKAFMLIGGWSAKCFTKSDEKWINNWSKKVNNIFSKNQI